MDNYYVPVENRKNQNYGGKMSLIKLFLMAITVISNIIRQTGLVTILLIRTTFNCFLAILFINPYPKWK